MLKKFDHNLSLTARVVMQFSTLSGNELFFDACRGEAWFPIAYFSITENGLLLFLLVGPVFLSKVLFVIFVICLVLLVMTIENNA